MARAHPAPPVLAAALVLAGMVGAPCAAGPTASVSRSSVAFARVAQGAPSAVQPVFVTNIGDAALVVTALAITGDGAADFQLAASGTCDTPATLGPGQRCRIDVVALPQWTRTQDVSASLTVESNDGTAEVRLTATADTTLLAPIVTSARAFVEFPLQQVSMPSAPQSLTIANGTTLPLTLGHPALLGGDATDFVATTDCPLEHPLEPGRICAVTLTFMPRGAGPRATELVFEVAQGEVTAFYRWSVTGTGGE